MALVCDTGCVFGLYDADDAHHAAIRGVVEREPGPLFLPLILLAEVDYLLATRLGPQAASDFLESVEHGAFLLVPLLPSDLTRCIEIVRQYSDLRLGLADAAVVTAAERPGIQRVLTLDERHSRAIKLRGFSHFILLPADAESPRRGRAKGTRR